MADWNCNVGLALNFPTFIFAQRTWISKIAWKYSFSLSFDIPRTNILVKKSVFSYLWFSNIKLKYNNPSTYLIITDEKDYLEIASFRWLLYLFHVWSKHCNVNMFCKIQNPLAVHTEINISESFDLPSLYSKL